MLFHYAVRFKPKFINQCAKMKHYECMFLFLNLNLLDIYRLIVVFIHISKSNLT